MRHSIWKEQHIENLIILWFMGGLLMDSDEPLQQISCYAHVYTDIAIVTDL